MWLWFALICAVARGACGPPAGQGVLLALICVASAAWPVPHALLSLTGAIPPITVYDQNGFKAMLHFSRDPAPGRVNVLVMVLSLLSTSAQPIQDIVFQAAVPKVRGGLKK